MLSRVEIVRFNQAGGVRTVSTSLEAALTECGYEVSFIEIAPPKDSLIRIAAKAALRGNGKLRSIAFTRFSRKEQTTPAPINASRERAVRIYTHPNLVAKLPLKHEDINIGWYHDSWDAAEQNGHADTARIFSEGFDQYVLLSKKDAEFAQSALGVECSYIPNPLPPAISRDSSSRLSRIIMLTRHEPQKDIPLALRSWREAQLDDRWELVIYGAGSQQRSNQTLARRLGVTGVTFHDWTRDPTAELSRSHALLSTSLHEGFPATFLEALSTGTPIVAVDSFPACRELVTHDTGIRIESRNYRDVADALRGVALLNSSRYEAMGVASREKAKDYSLGNIAGLWSKLFQEMEKQKLR